MNDPGKDEQIANQAKELFDDSVERLDAAALSRLNQGRHRALAELEQSGPSATWVRWVPAAGVTAAAVVTVGASATAVSVVDWAGVRPARRMARVSANVLAFFMPATCA